MIRALVIDDEPMARQELVAQLREMAGCEIIGTCANAFEAVKEISRKQPNVIFLDIQMPVLSGFDLLNMIDPTIMPYVVFVTAYDEYALKAFEEKTLDYLLKPVDAPRLKKTFDKIENLLQLGHRPQYQPSAITRVPCGSGSRIKLVNPLEIEYVRADLSGVHVVLPAEEFYSDLTLKVLEERTGLIRCHRQYLVNLEYIREVRLLDNGLAEISTSGGHLLPVSRRYRRKLKGLLSF